MTDDSSQEEKQNFLRENILEKGYDTNMFVEFLMDKKGEDGADVGNWSMNDLKIVVKEFISMQQNYSNPIQEPPVINNNPPIPQKTVKNDPLSLMSQKPINNNPLEAPKAKITNDPLQNKPKKQEKLDPLSGAISQSKEQPKKQNSSMADFFSAKDSGQNKTIINQPPIQQNLNMNPQIQPQMQNQFPPQYFNQFPNYTNQNQINQQFQPQTLQGQFPQPINQQEQNNSSVKNTSNIQQNSTNSDIKQPIPTPQSQLKNNDAVKPIPEKQKQIPQTPNVTQEGGKQNSKDDVGILYGVITNSLEISKTVDKTPLGISDNPSIQVGFPEKVEGGFFSKSYITYLLTTIPLNLKVRRRYSDFEWLRQILISHYIGNVIPTTPRKNKLGSDKFGDAFLQKRMRTLEKFLNYLLMNPIIKYSQLFYDFISIENETDFNKKKKEYEKMKAPQNINDHQSLTGKINVEVKKEKEIFFENIKDNISFNESLLTKLNENFKLLKIQLENLTLKIDEIVLIWNELCKTSTKYFDGDDIIQSYENMSKLFTNWSDALKRHTNLIHIDIREYFKYVKNNFKSMKDLVSIVDSNKYTFNKNEKYLINRKEDLFRKGEINKWDLDPNDRDRANNLIQDKSTALMKMIPKETNNVINLKKIYGYYLNRIIDEYERLKSINSLLHKKNLVNACEKLTEIYGDFQKGTTDIINFFNAKDKIAQNLNNIKN